MYSMWDAPSDRDYLDQFNPPEMEEPEPPCLCGAGADQACEQWCDTYAPAGVVVE